MNEFAFLLRKLFNNAVIHMPEKRFIYVSKKTSTNRLKERNQINYFQTYTESIRKTQLSLLYRCLCIYCKDVSNMYKTMKMR